MLRHALQLPGHAMQRALHSLEMAEDLCLQSVHCSTGTVDGVKAGLGCLLHSNVNWHRDILVHT